MCKFKGEFLLCDLYKDGFCLLFDHFIDYVPIFLKNYQIIVNRLLI